MPDAYTRPEMSTERGIARRMRAKVTAAGGCAYCLHAVHGWGRSACDAPNRTFPRCLATPGTKFEPDYDRLRSDP